MKKIVSLVIFVCLLIWTWNVIHRTSPIEFETHSAIQAKLSELIAQNLINKVPNATDLKITQIWTETLENLGGPETIKAHFSFKFVEPLSEGGTPVEEVFQEHKGEAILARQNSDDPGVDSWKLLEVKSLSSGIQFQEGSKFQDGDKTDDQKSELAPPNNPNEDAHGSK